MVFRLPGECTCTVLIRALHYIHSIRNAYIRELYACSTTARVREEMKKCARTRQRNACVFDRSHDFSSQRQQQQPVCETQPAQHPSFTPAQHTLCVIRVSCVLERNPRMQSRVCNATARRLCAMRPLDASSRRRHCTRTETITNGVHFGVHGAHPENLNMYL